MLKYAKTIFKWLMISLLMGIIGGIIGSLFHHLIEIVTHTREKHSWLIIFLPVAGLVITALYHPFRSKGGLNTNRILSSVEADDDVPVILSPLIFVSTLITHLFGGSAGREGAALQLGGSIGYNVGRLIKLNKDELHIIVMAGMSAFFSAMFGTPLTAAIFSLEVIRVHNTHRKSLLPCMISSATAYIIARFIGSEGVRYSVESMGISVGVIVKTLILAALCALVSIAFCLAIKYTSRYMKKFISNEYIRAFTGGAVVVVLALVLRTTDYNGAGMSVIDLAMEGEASYVSFALKIIFTAITIAAGFRGGEIVPTLFVGATFGCAFGGLLGLEEALAASLGFVALFAGVVKCPLASVVLAVEVFGSEGVLLYALACVVTYLLSGKFSIYEHSNSLGKKNFLCKINKGEVKMAYKIIVSKGSFDTVEEAAFGETKISWADSYSDDCRACTECFSALDAKSVLDKYKNLNVEVCDITEFSENGDVLIFLGDECAKFAAEKYNLPYEKVTEEEGYRIFGAKKGEKQIILLHGDGRRGSVYAMDEYMEYHGIRFISPGEDGTHYCESLDKSKNTQIDIKSAPSYRTREASSEFANDTSTELLMWLFHNKYNFLFLVKFEHGELLQKLGLGVTAGGHAIWYNYMDINHEYPYKHKIFGGEGKPEDPYEVSPLYKGDVNGDGILTYGEAHPEWYAEVDGVHNLHRDYEYQAKGYWTGDFICTSNEDATDEFVKLIVDALAEGEFRDASKFKLSTLDNGTWCECEKCKNAGSLSYRMLMFAHKLDKAIKKATQEGRIKRKIALLTQAYHETLPPPDRELPEDFDYSAISVGFYVIERCYLHNIDDHGCEETNKWIFDNIKAWSGGYYKGQLLMGEYYNVSTFAALPFVLEKRIRNDIPVFYNTGTRHFVYLHMLARTWGVQALNNYLLKSMLWDINCDADRVVEEYFLARYGEDAEKMKAVYKELEDAGANCKYIKHYQWVAAEGKTFALSRCLNEGNPHFFPLKHCRLDYREDDYQAGPSLLEMRDRFEALFEDFKEYIKEKDKASLIEDYEQFEYGVYMMNYLYYKSLSMLKDNSEETLKKVELYKQKLKGVTRPLSGYDYGVRYENGLAATGDHEV